MVYTSCKFLIPAQYKYGLSRTQTSWTSDQYGAWAYDMDFSTAGTLPTPPSSISITFGQACVLNQLFVTWEGRRNTGTRVFNPQLEASNIAIAGYTPEYGTSTYWDSTTTVGFVKDTSASSLDRSSCLFNLTNTSSGDDYSIYLNGAMTGTKNFYHIVWSETFALPLWDRGASLGMSFSQTQSRTAHDNLFDAWKRSKTFYVETSRTLKWTGLTAAQWLVFKNAFLAFGDSIKKPFVVARITDAGAADADFANAVQYEAEFQVVAMRSDPQYSKDRSGLYSVTLDLVQSEFAY